MATMFIERFGDFFIQFVLSWAALIVLAIVVAKRHKKIAEGIYRDYYTRKRKEFPWLEDWLSKNPDTAILRAHSAAAGGAPFIVFVFFVVGIVLGGIIEKVVPRKTPLFAIFEVAVVVVAFIVATKVEKSRIKSPEKEAGDDKELTLECPSCHCPHAWGMVFFQYIPDNIETSTSTTERWQEDSSGNRVMGSTSSKTYRDTIITGKMVRDFKCDNCGHTYRAEDAFGLEHMPNTTPKHFNPPVYAWKPSKNPA